MDPNDLLHLLPDDVEITIVAWLPRVLAYLVLATALVHVLLPLARRVEAWANASSATWDDGPAHRVVVALEWAAAASAAILAWLPRLAVGNISRGDSTPRGAQASASHRDRSGSERRARRNIPPATPTVLEVDTRDRGGPPDSAAALALVVLAAALAGAAVGCSSGPQLPIVTVPMTISCTWSVPIGDTPSRDATADTATSTDATAGVVIADNDCSIDRSAASADPTTVGNDNRGARVDARVPVTVSGTGGSGQ